MTDDFNRRRDVIALLEASAVPLTLDEICASIVCTVGPSRFLLPRGYGQGVVRELRRQGLVDAVPGRPQRFKRSDDGRPRLPAGFVYRMTKTIHGKPHEWIETGHFLSDGGRLLLMRWREDRVRSDVRPFMHYVTTAADAALVVDRARRAGYDGTWTPAGLTGIGGHLDAPFAEIERFAAWLHGLLTAQRQSGRP